MPLKVELIAHGDEAVCAKAALTCTSAESVHDIFAANKDFLSVLERVYKMGHTSVSEHMWFTFIISGVSRSLTHQLVRTRMASYSQRSQRYVTEGNFEFVIPPKIEAHQSALDTFNTLMADINEAYAALLHYGIPAEDARFVLPNACETQVVMTINARALIHFLAERLCTCAQWEIRALANAMVAAAVKVSPTIMQFAGPKCKAGGVCYETKARCCGRVPHQSKLVTISVEEYTRLNVDAAYLGALNAAGVDNWGGYDEAVRSVEDAG